VLVTAARPLLVSTPPHPPLTILLQPHHHHLLSLTTYLHLAVDRRTQLSRSTTPTLNQRQLSQEKQDLVEGGQATQERGKKVLEEEGEEEEERTFPPPPQAVPLNPPNPKEK
jgi:hypothetical protein